MSRRTAGPAASTPARAGAGRKPGAGRPGAGSRAAFSADAPGPASRGQPATRLAATLGGPHSDAPGLEAAGPPEPAGLLKVGDGREFSYGSSDGPRSARASHELAETRVRWRLGLRAAVLLGMVSLVAGGWFWWQVAAAEPEVVPLSAVTSEPAGTGGPAGSTAGEGGEDTGRPAEAGERSGPGSTPGIVVVHVAGAVKKTGVVKVPRGGRVHEAIAAAGGGTAAADLNRLNLAAVLDDGQKIYVPRRGEAIPPDAVQQGTQGSQPEGTGAGGTGAAGTGTGAGGSTAAGGSGSVAAAGKVNLNTATAEELGSLPRVGPVLAQRIVDWRTEHGQFKTAEELDAVDGVGPKMLETLLPLVTV